MMALRSFRDLPEAEVTSAALESAGIPNFLANAETVGVNWNYSQAIGGVRLEVFESDAEEAADLLQAVTHVPYATPGPAAAVDETLQRCPNCGSADVMMDYGARRVAAVLLLLTPMLATSWLLWPLLIPLFFVRTRARCRACDFVRRVPFRLRPERLLAYGAASLVALGAMASVFLLAAFLVGLVEQIR